MLEKQNICANIINQNSACKKKETNSFLYEHYKDWCSTINIAENVQRVYTEIF